MRVKAVVVYWNTGTINAIAIDEGFVVYNGVSSPRSYPPCLQLYVGKYIVL